MTKKLVWIARLLAVVLAVSCRNPLMTIGLGDRIDLQNPNLSLTSYANGAYVSGITISAPKTAVIHD